ncbi:MAG: hypothetical protein WA705_16690 [Candidatus Ozemobacteraceae bacterium]
MKVRAVVLVAALVCGLWFTAGCGKEPKVAGRETMLAFFQACKTKNKDAFLKVFDAGKIADAAVKVAQAEAKKRGFPMLGDVMNGMRYDLTNFPEKIFFSSPTASWDKAVETLVIKEDPSDSTRVRAHFSTGFKNMVYTIELREKDWIIVAVKVDK